MVASGEAVRGMVRWFWARMRVRTRYTRELEDEIARLRAENRGLVNSILGVAGMPRVRVGAMTGRIGLHRARRDERTPVGAGAARVDKAKTLTEYPTLRREHSLPSSGQAGWGTRKGKDAPFLRQGKQGEGRLGRRDYETEEGNGIVAALRRRSWQQIGRLREIEDARAARRERETDTETFPTPRQIVPRG